MAANSTIAAELKIDSVVIGSLRGDLARERTETGTPKIMTLKQRIRLLAREVFEGREEFLGMTPD